MQGENQQELNPHMTPVWESNPGPSNKKSALYCDISAPFKEVKFLYSMHEGAILKSQPIRARQRSSIITGADTGVHSGAYGWSAKVYRYVLLIQFEVRTLG